MRRSHVAVRAALLLAGLLTACGSTSSPLASDSTPLVVTTTSAPGPSTTGAGETSSAVPSVTSVSTAAPTTVAATTTSPPVVRPAVAEVARAGSAKQAIVVSTPVYGVSDATLTAYGRTAAGDWEAVMGPWSARVGRNGFAPPGQKVEGDGRTPSGTYDFSFLFGVAADPGVLFEYRRVPDASIVWDEDPASPTYNLWIDLDDYGGGTDPEGMYQPVAYQHGAVIAYNTARTPGLGSGIFLHATTGRATAGCVSLPVTQLVALLRWLDPAREPRIVMGVAA